MKIRLLIFIISLFSLRSYSQSCTLNVNVSSSETAICAGNTVMLTAAATGGSGNYDYSWSTGETAAQIAVNKAGTYSVTVTDKTTGCPPVKKDFPISVSPTPDAPIVKGGGSVCVNTRADLSAIGPGGVYRWYTQETGGTPVNTGPNYQTDPITVPTAFYVETTVGGCTSLRTVVIIKITGKPNGQDAQACFGSPVTLSVSNGDTFRWYTSPTSTSIVHTGSSFVIPSLKQTVTYYVEADVNGCTSSRTSVTATVVPPPEPPTVDKVPVVCAGSVVSLHANAAAGVIDWYATATGGTPLISSPDYTTQTLNANTTYYVQTTLNDCQSSRVPFTVKVNPIPAAPASQNIQACYGVSAHLTASNTPTGTYQWFSDAAGKHAIHTGPDYDTPVLTHSITYYIANISSGCSSDISPINVTLISSVPTPSVTAPLTCYGAVATLVATPSGGTYQWFKTATDNNILFTGEQFVTPVLTGNTTYYVQSVIGSCASARIAVPVKVQAQIAPPTAKDTTTCAGNTATLTANGPDGDYAWYDKAVNGNLLQVGKVFETPALTATTRYYVQVTLNGCQSSLVPVKVTVTPLPSAPTPGGPYQVCPGNAATLTASVAGGSLAWFDTPNGGTPLSTDNSFVTPSLFVNTTYYVQNTSGSCNSARVPVTVTINNTGSSFSYPSGTVSTSGANTTPAIINPAGGIFNATPSGLVFVSNATGEINVAASTPGTYIITLTSNGACGSYTSSITLSDLPKANFSYDSPFCQDGTNPSPVFPPGASGGVFTATPIGLIFANNNTGQIDFSNSKAGTYTVKNTIPASGNAPEVSSISDVTINERVAVDAGNTQSVPVGTPVTLQGKITGAAGGKWTGGGGSFSNVNDLNAVYTPAAGESIVKLTLTSNNPPGPCDAKSALVTILYNRTPPAPKAQPASVCLGDDAVLSATSPGGTYKWYIGATGGNSIQTGPIFTTPKLFANTTYYVETTLNGLTSPRTAVAVTVNTVPIIPTAADTVICSGGIANLKATGSAGTYQWYTKNANGQFQLLQLGDTYETPPLTASTTYYVQAVIGKCVSPQKEVTVQVNPVPIITSGAFDFICSGNALNYNITADLPAATFLWSRAALPGISNPAQSQASASITETLINTTPNAINVTYVITAMSGSCSGAPLNYIVTVYPTPVVTSKATDTICYGTTANYAIKFNTPQTSFSWSRAAIPGIKNASIAGQAAGVIREVLFNTTGAPIEVTYTINYKTSDCDGTPFNWVVTVNPLISITSDTVSAGCSKTPQGYAIKSNVLAATFTWRRDAVAGISNPTATGSGALIDEALVNTTTSAVAVGYIITPIAYGCTGLPFLHIVSVNPKPDLPIANSNQPVCVGSTIQLRTPSLNRATYMWTGPNGFSSSLQNPDVVATVASRGTYNLFVTIDGCTSDASPVDVMVNEPPVVEAHGPSLVCTDASTINLTGSVTGGTSTGIWSSSNPNNNKFLPTPTSIDNVQYIPSAEDKAKGSVTLTLSSTSKDDCNIATASVVIKFGKAPGAAAGNDQNICSQENRVQLAGKILEPSGVGHWTTTGKGKFSSATQADAFYVPDPADIQAGSVTLTFHADNAGACYTESDKLVVTFVQPPVLVTERIRYVLKGKTITLNPTVRDLSVRYLWSPNINISDVNIKNPVITGGDTNQTYILTIADSLNCVSVDSTLVIVSPQLSVSNAFSPNGDGTNDNWEIVGLTAYENATVDIFNRYGTLVFHSKGYGIPWDGRSGGQPVPSGVYYYIVDTKVNRQVFKGDVTVLR